MIAWVLVRLVERYGVVWCKIDDRGEKSNSNKRKNCKNVIAIGVWKCFKENWITVTITIRKFFLVCLSLSYLFTFSVPFYHPFSLSLLFPHSPFHLFLSFFLCLSLVLSLSRTLSLLHSICITLSLLFISLCFNLFLSRFPVLFVGHLCD